MPNSSDFNRFSVNPTNIDISRSLFNMNHSVKFSCNVGEVIPFDVIEVLPGDTFSIDTSKVIRLQPLVAPIMDEVILDTYWFFVPNRLVWSHWKEFMGENNTSAWSPDVEYSIPTISAPLDPDDPDPDNDVYKFKVGTIADYMGLPAGMNVYSSKYNALPFRAYALICSEWFRSEAVMDPVHVFTDDTNRVGSNGDDQVSDIELGGKPFIACKFFDYFTSCLPSPQRGDPVSLNLVSNNTSIPVTTRSNGVEHPYDVGKTLLPSENGVMVTHRPDSSNTVIGFSSNASLDVDNTNHLRFGTAPASEQTNQQVYFSNLFVNVSKSTFDMISVNDLRTAFAMQKYLEKQARYGGRYTEFIKGFFNVDSPDARLQRSEYLGGSRMSLNINSVEQTSATQNDTTPLGDVAGMSVTADQNSDFTKSFTEHGFIIGCSVVRYHHSYQQMTHKMWLHGSPYTFYNPVMANLGEQAVTVQELYTSGSGKTDAFGYQERWAEYRYLPNKICGQMRSTYDQP